MATLDCLNIYSSLVSLNVRSSSCLCISLLDFLSASLSVPVFFSPYHSFLLSFQIKISSKIRLMRSLVISIFLYACETWTLTEELEKKIQTTEMRCFRRLLGFSYRDHVTNEEVGNRIKQAVGPYEDLLTIVKKRKLRWYGHKTRSTGLAKMILQGTVQGGRRRGRQKKRWEDNIKEWTGLKLGEALRKAENREEWRTVVARSFLVPQRSTRLRDK